MTTASLSSLPRELRLIIYELCIRDRDSRLNILSLNREIHKEVQSVIYQNRNLVFRTHPGCILQHEPTDLRDLQNGLVSVALEHAFKAPIRLPPLPWRERRCDMNPSHRHLPIDYMVNSCNAKIVIHVHEPPEDDTLQVLMSYWAVNGIHEFLQQLFPKDILRLQIITHVLSQPPIFARDARVMGSKWDVPDGLRVFHRCSGDLSIILATLWADTDVYLDIHTTPAIAQHLVEHGFFHKPDTGECAGRILGYFPPLELLPHTESMLPGGVVVNFRGNTWRSKGLSCRCGSDPCSCMTKDFARIVIKRVFKWTEERSESTSRIMSNLLCKRDLDLWEIPWDTPDITNKREPGREYRSDGETTDSAWSDGDISDSSSLFYYGYFDESGESGESGEESNLDDL